MEKLLGDARLIRHWGKLKSVRDNAAAMLAVADEFGSFGAWLATWPGDNIVGLWEALADALQPDGRQFRPDAFCAWSARTRSCCRSRSSPALKRWAEMPRRRKTARTARRLRPASTPGRPRPAGRLSQLSMILALSVDE